VNTVSKTNTPKYCGLSGAANFLGCDPRAVRRHSDAGRLPCVRDATGKRLFTISNLRRFMRKYHVGNRCRPQCAR
jgi:hypothetical protein